MNKIFKVVWSKVKHCYVVVSEIAKNTISGGARRCRVRKGALAAALVTTVLGSSFVMPNSAWAAAYDMGTSYEALIVLSAKEVGEKIQFGIELWRGDVKSARDDALGADPSLKYYEYNDTQNLPSQLKGISGYYYTKVSSVGANATFDAAIEQTVINQIISSVKNGENVSVTPVDSNQDGVTDEYAISAVDTKNKSVSLSINNDNELVVSVIDANKNGEYTKSGAISLNDLKAKIDTDTTYTVTPSVPINNKNVVNQWDIVAVGGTSIGTIVDTNTYVTEVKALQVDNKTIGTRYINNNNENDFVPGFSFIAGDGINLSVDNNNNAITISSVTGGTGSGSANGYEAGNNVIFTTETGSNKIKINADVEGIPAYYPVSEQSLLQSTAQDDTGQGSGQGRKQLATLRIGDDEFDVPVISVIDEVDSNAPLLKAVELNGQEYRIADPAWTVRVANGGAVSSFDITDTDAVEYVAGSNIVLSAEATSDEDGVSTGGKIVVSTANNVVFDSVTVGGKVVINNSGITMGNQKITGLAPGEYDDDAVNFGQLKSYVTGVDKYLVSNPDPNAENGEYTVVKNKVTLKVKNGKDDNGDDTYTDVVIDGIASKTELDTLAGKVENAATEASKKTTVTGSSNITVTPAADSSKANEYNVALNNDITLTTINTNDNNEVIGQVAIKSSDSTVIVGIDNNNKVSIDGANGSITGLNNIIWTPDTVDYSQSKKAATEAQLHIAVNKLKSDITTNISELNNLSVTGGEEVNGKYHGWQLEDSSEKDENGNAKIYSDTTLDTNITKVTVNEDGIRTLTVADTAGHSVVLDDIASASEVNQRFDNIEGNITNIRTDISNLTTDVTNIRTDISNLTTDVTNIRTDISNLTTDVTNIRGDISNLTTDVSNIRNDITNITGNQITSGSIAAYEYDAQDGGSSSITLVTEDVNDNDIVLQGLKDTTLRAGTINAVETKDSDGKLTNRTYTFSDTNNNEVVLNDVASASKLQEVETQVSNNSTAIEKNTADITNLYNNDQILSDTISKNANRINQLGNRMNKVGAGSAALAALHPMDFDPDDKLQFSAGVGHYGGENAAALGAFYRPTEKVMFSVAGTMGNGEDMVNAGVTFALDKPNNVSNSRVAMAREIQDLRQQVAALTMLVMQMASRDNAALAGVAMFPDVPENHWAYDYIEGLQKQGIIEGYPDGNFGGDRSMTRYEFAAMLYRALEKGFPVDSRLLNEFNAELGRIRVDRIKGVDNDANKVERVRVNNYEDRDDYGSKIVQVKAGA